ncbi:MAG: alkaline phosphatase family protein [Solirubrobacteraceae bacterium]
MRRAVAAAFVVLVGLGLVGASGALAAPVEGIHKIQHVIVIMQENRSFDSYFGTYPGANGIPAGVCEPDPVNGGCVAPFHDSSDENYGGPHGQARSRRISTGARWTASSGRPSMAANAAAPNRIAVPAPKVRARNAST